MSMFPVTEVDQDMLLAAPALAARLIAENVGGRPSGIPADEAARLIAEAFLRGRLQAELEWSGQRACRVCACTETTACDTDQGACWWAAHGVCSACAPFLATAVAFNPGD